jgi:hypothetical protein
VVHLDHQPRAARTASIAASAPTVSQVLERSPAADSAPWQLTHGFCDDAGYLFLRYARS